MAICNPTETNSSRQNPSQQKYSRKSAQNFRKPTVILQHLQLKAGKQWRCSCSLGSNSIQLSRQGGKTYGQEKKTRLSTYNLLGGAADDPIPKIFLT